MYKSLPPCNHLLFKVGFQLGALMGTMTLNIISLSMVCHYAKCHGALVNGPTKINNLQN